LARYVGFGGTIFSNARRNAGHVMMVRPVRQILRWDPYLDPDEEDMEFRLTYAGPLYAHKRNKKWKERSLHIHEIRRQFQRQLKILWAIQPALIQAMKDGSTVEVYSGSGCPPLNQIFPHDGFNWLPMVTKHNGLICKVDLLLLRPGPPGDARSDIDNRLKVVFDALRKADGPDELGAGTSKGQMKPEGNEDPFFVVLQDDCLITHLSVTTDTLLEPVPNTPPDNAVRLVLDIKVSPYRGFVETAGYAG
jgi:hypothetical protein